MSLKSLIYFLLSAFFLVSCSTIPKNHVGIIFNKRNNKNLRVKDAGIVFPPISKKSTLVLIKLTRTDTLNLKFLTRDGKSMAYSLLYNYRINDKNIKKLINFINSYNKDFKSTLKRIEQAELRAATRSVLGGYTKQELETRNIEKTISKSIVTYLPTKFWEIETVSRNR